MPGTMAWGVRRHLPKSYMACKTDAMTLSDYLSTNKLTLRQFAEAVGRSEATISRIARGRHRPDWETLEAINTATGGLVTPNDFLPKRGEAA